MGMADLDLDGDLDIVVNNLRAPAQLFENSLCGGQALEVDLRWPGSRNVFAVGARLELDVDGQTLVRHVHAASGYLFGDAPRVHFGLGAPAQSPFCGCSGVTAPSQCSPGLRQERF
jgi:hypothetical protein